MATEQEIEAVARALAKCSALQAYDQGGGVPDLNRATDKLWKFWRVEAKAAIEAYERSRALVQ